MDDEVKNDVPEEPTPAVEPEPAEVAVPQPAGAIDAPEPVDLEPPAMPEPDVVSEPVVPEPTFEQAPPPPPPSAPAPGGYAPPPPAAAPAGAGAKNKVTAGILALLLNGLGIHKFYLGYQKEGIIMLAVTLVGACVGVGPLVMGVIGVIEGIIYLTKSDEEFYQTYVVGRKGWF